MQITDARKVRNDNSYFEILLPTIVGNEPRGIEVIIFHLPIVLQQRYLMNFGYLPQNDLETGNLRTEDQLRDAIKDMQVSSSNTTHLSRLAYRLSLASIFLEIAYRTSI